MSGIRRLGALAARSLARRVFAPPHMHHRSFGAAALAEVEYWTEWEEDEERGRYAAAAATDACGEREPRRVQWVFMGSPGVQRHVYATRVAELLDVPYISMGSLVRQELNPSSSLYKKIANVVNEGRLVPEKIIFGLLSKRLEEGYQRGETGFILDGIPRTRIQAEILDQIANIDLVVNLQCRDDCLVKKHFGADICSHCGKTFDSSNSESTNLNLCLATRTRHAQLKPSAAVDMKDSCIEKFRVYSEQIKLLEEYYTKQKKLLDVQVTGGPGETWQGLLAALHLQHMDTASSQKLTV
ncbi:hypothetical protein OPV22_021404 [Ensete ventricosum]|uniref:adenylate kinase n=1 Tax=Ensete ventricosum TaxID=4639 RepID=A0AAV8QNF6_ENSVE|nr:hypothetical protein OPV22_021404 [Ensete ventricosum]